MLFMVAAMAAEMERDVIRERTLDGLRAAEVRRGGPCRRPVEQESSLEMLAGREQGVAVSGHAQGMSLDPGQDSLR
jgi:DNA invertase Pin-like site-specific DNA recombinase